MSLLKIVNL